MQVHLMDASPQWYTEPTNGSAGRVWLDRAPDPDWEATFHRLARQMGEPAPWVNGDVIELPATDDRHALAAALPRLIERTNRLEP
jgi:hypothetical protein